ncbi:YdcF family protein [Vacuolonema iberomarrocanum]|uniref:YdcF family protein n=1 Tax=Vacuolonema iberomarrocanum TaxID=3454632 RepID=UPI0019DEDFDF|nr:YdcF family protein [filamentous cyanobacterium LEGE 07170]
MNVLRSLIGGNWSKLNWGLYEILTNPRLVTLGILLVVVLLIIGSYPVWRKRILRGLMIALCTYWVIISPPFVALAEGVLMSAVPADSGETADAIVVIGRGAEETGDRYPQALQLLEQERAPELFITGRYNFPRIGRLLDDYDVSVRQLSGTICARTTKDEALWASTLMGPRGVRRIILVTDRPHMLRAYLTFQWRGFSVIPHPVALNISSARHSMLTLREYLGLVSYGILGRLFPGSTHRLTNPPAELVQNIERWDCEAIPAKQPELLQTQQSRHQQAS